MREAVVLTFANSEEEAHLKLLKTESSLLNDILAPLHDKGALEMASDESATVDSVTKLFNRFDKRMCIFHYAGHAGGKELLLEEGTAHAEGVAELLKQQNNNLALVFLNGCSTLPQVDRLISNGIKAIIATSVKIADPQAVDFANWFYQSLSFRKTLKEAFEFAAASLKMKYDEADMPVIVEYRGERTRVQKQDTLPWGLYINEDHKEILDWQMPVTPKRRTYQSQSDFKPNAYLPHVLLYMAEHDPELGQTITRIEEGEMDQREALPIVIHRFPWTIGAQLQKLVSNSTSMRELGLDRLAQIINTYVISAQFLYYILLSQLWEECRSQSDIEIENHMLQVLNLDAKSRPYFDYVAALGQVGRLFGQHKWKPFIEGYNEIILALKQKDTNHLFYKAYLSLDTIRVRLADNQLGDDEAPELCEEAEDSLKEFLGAVSFLIQYQTLAVRDITVSSYRHQEISYLHKIGHLNAQDESYLKLNSAYKPFPQPAGSGEIMLVPTSAGSRLDQSLSLSPFIIDNNAYLDKSQEALDVYIYSHRNKDAFIYKNVNSNFQKMEEHDTYQISTGYIEQVEAKSSFSLKRKKEVRPYAILQKQFEDLHRDILREDLAASHTEPQEG